MGNTARLLSRPATDLEYENGTCQTYKYSGVSMQGWRKNQEDRFVIVCNLYDDWNYFGVFDGHGGPEVAEILKRRFHLELKRTLEVDGDMELALHSSFLSFDNSLRDSEAIAELNEILEEENLGASHILRSYDAQDMDMPGAEDNPDVAGPSSANYSERPAEVNEAVTPAEVEGSVQQDGEERMQDERPLHHLLFDETDVPSESGDEDFVMNEDEESSETEESSDDEEPTIDAEEFINQQAGHFSGSTATVALLRLNQLYVANVGDSKCVLSRNGRAIDMSLDHKPEDPDERARIISAGGTISDDGRVDGCLNLSRAFGDFKFKGDSADPSQQRITAEPFIKTIEITNEDNFLIIASDGIWNSMSSQEVVDFIQERIRDEDANLETICEEMFHLVLAKDTENDGAGCDNMTCIVIKLNGNDGSSSSGSS